MSTHTPERLRCEVCDMPTLGDTLCNLHDEEQEKMTHTPGPWRVTKHDTLKDMYHIDAGPKGYERERIAIVDTGEANAAFIVRACNSHEVMLEALIQAQSVLGDLVRAGGASIDEIEAYSGVKEAIRLAEGRP